MHRAFSHTSKYTYQYTIQCTYFCRHKETHPWTYPLIHTHIDITAHRCKPLFRHTHTCSSVLPWELYCLRAHTDHAHKTHRSSNLYLINQTWRKWRNPSLPILDPLPALPFNYSGKESQRTDDHDLKWVFPNLREVYLLPGESPPVFLLAKGQIAESFLGLRVGCGWTLKYISVSMHLCWSYVLECICGILER